MASTMAPACNCPPSVDHCTGQCSSSTFRPQAHFTYTHSQPGAELNFNAEPYISASHTGPHFLWNQLPHGFAQVPPTSSQYTGAAPPQIDPALTAGNTSSHPHSTSKRPRTDDTNAPNKRVRGQQQSYIYGFVPPDPNPPPPLASNGLPTAAHPTSDRRYQSKLRKPAVESFRVTATDVYYFLRALKTSNEPDSLPEEEPRLTSRPKPSEYPFVGCRLCTEQWTVYSNSNSQTSTIRKHLKSAHPRLYRHFVIAEKLKGWETIDKEDWARRYERAEFTLDGFYQRLIRWIAVDDQSLSVVDGPELRELLLYIGTHLEPDMIPHRTKLADLIMGRFISECNALQKELESALGSISFTSDMWSRRDQNGFMAMTAHYVVKATDSKYALRSRLIAFRHISGSHSGERLAEEFVKVLDQFGLAERIGWVTLDNASVCAKMMAGLERRLKGRGIPFDKDGNRIHCFPHVVNIAVQASLRKFTWTPKRTEDERRKDAQRVEGNPDALGDFEDSDDYVECALDELLGVDVNAEGHLSDEQYWAILGSDVVKRARKLVEFMRKSIGRREKLAKVVSSLREEGELGRRVVLLKDMDVRWSSTFMMLDRLLELYPAIVVLKNSDDVLCDELEGFMLSDADRIVLNDITSFLVWPHRVQELVSSERTPTLSVVIPLYETLRDKLAALRDHDLTRISTAIQAATDKLDTYFNMARCTPVYAIAMVINPTIKFTWIEGHCDEADKDRFHAHIVDYMTRIKQSKVELLMQQDGTDSPTPSSSTSSSVHPVGLRTVQRPTASRATANLQGGIASFMQEIQASTSAPAPAESAREVASTHRTFSDMSKAERDEFCRDAACKELQAYLDAGVSKDDDLLHFWRINQDTYPLLHRVAMDVLPVQASSVPCERVFSSGKETDTLRRSSMSPFMLEVLQVLKYGFMADRVSFAEEWSSVPEEDLQIVDIPDDDARKLLKRGAIDELNRLMDSALDVPPDDGLD